MLCQAVHSPYVEHAHNGSDHDAEDEQGQLGPSADERSHEGQVRGGTEHVAVHQLPARLLTHIALLRERGRAGEQKGGEGAWDEE